MSLLLQPLSGGLSVSLLIVQIHYFPENSLLEQLFCVTLQGLIFDLLVTSRLCESSPLFEKDLWSDRTLTACPRHDGLKLRNLGFEVRFYY